MSIRTRGAALLAALACVSLVVIGSMPKTLADPVQPPPPKPLPNPVAQPDDLPRIAPIGGAQVKTNTPLGLGPGTGRPLAAGRERSNATISPSPTDGTHLPTAIAGKDVVLHLPQERDLTPAQWGDGDRPPSPLATPITAFHRSPGRCGREHHSAHHLYAGELHLRSAGS